MTNSGYHERLKLIESGLDLAIWAETDAERQIGPEATVLLTQHLAVAHRHVQTALRILASPGS